MFFFRVAISFPKKYRIACDILQFHQNICDKKQGLSQVKKNSKIIAIKFQRIIATFAIKKQSYRKPKKLINKFAIKSKNYRKFKN